MSPSKPESRETPSTFVPSGSAPGKHAACGRFSQWQCWRLRRSRRSESWSPGRGSSLGRLDPVERVAADYLKAMSTEDSATIKRLGTVEEPPAIRSVRSVDPESSGRSTAQGLVRTPG